MNKNQMFKWVVAPTLAFTLLLPSGNAFVFSGGEVHAAEVQTQSAKRIAFNNYTSEMLAYLITYSEAVQSLTFDKLFEPIPEDPQPSTKTQEGLEAVLSAIDTNMPSQAYIKSKYGEEVAVIHGHFISTMKSSKIAYAEWLKVEKGEGTDNSETIIENSFDDVLTHSSKYFIALESYINKYNIDLSEDSYFLLYGEKPVYKTIDYIVKKGDTLYSLAKKYGVTVTELKEWNYLDSNTIHPGRYLLIDVFPGKSNVYTVQEYDTLFSIAYEFGLTSSELKSMNKLTSNNLKAGQDLFVNKKALSLQIVKKIHKVKKGETLYSISKKYKVSVADLKTLNNLKSNSVRVGQNLVYQKQTSTGKRVHTVQKGDTLHKVSQKYKISVADLKKINRLSSDSVTVGQNLVVQK